MMNVIQPPHPVLDKRGEPHVRRFEEQRWLIDNIIRANGIDWDQPRSLYISRPLRHRGQRRLRRHPRAREEDGRYRARPSRRWRAGARPRPRPPRRPASKVTARDNYFMAAVHWGAAQWPYDQNDETNVAYNQQEARVLRQIRRAGRPQGRGRLDSVQGQGAAGLVPSAAELQGRQHPGGDQRPGHGQLQGDPGRALRRPLPQPRLRRAGDRRPRPIRGADARHLLLAWRTGSATGKPLCDWLAKRPEVDMSGRLLRHQLRHVLRHLAHRARAAHPACRGDVGVPRARLPHDLPGGVADLQEALHVHVGHHRRGRVRQDSARPSPGRATPTRSACPISASPASSTS